MDNKFFLSEISVSYKNAVEYNKRLKISDSHSAEEIFRDIWKYRIKSKSWGE